MPFNEYTWEECHYCNHKDEMLKEEDESVEEGAIFNNFADVEGEFESDIENEDVYFEKNYAINKETSRSKM